MLVRWVGVLTPFGAKPHRGAQLETEYSYHIARWRNRVVISLPRCLLMTGSSQGGGFKFAAVNRPLKRIGAGPAS